MSMMGKLQVFLGLQIKQSKEGTFVHQTKYTKDIVRRFKMEDSKAMAMPMSMTTSLDADEEGERGSEGVPKHDWVTPILDGNEAGHPVLGMSVCSFSSVPKDFASVSGPSHFQVFASHSRLRTLALRVFFFGSSWILDADFAGCRLDRKFTSGTCQFLGSSLVSWSSHKQSTSAQSTIEAEYVATASCCSQLLWLAYTMSDFGEKYTNVPLQCDSTSAICVAKNPMLHSKTKHKEVRYHFLRDNVEKRKISLIHVPTQDQLADIFTKPLYQATFTRLRGEHGVFLFIELVCGRSFVAYV
jgi:hypothetical protein